MVILVLIAAFLIFGVILSALIYFIIRRIEIKKTEDFEDRDN